MPAWMITSPNPSNEISCWIRLKSTLIDFRLIVDYNLDLKTSRIYKQVSAVVTVYGVNVLVYDSDGVREEEENKYAYKHKYLFETSYTYEQPEEGGQGYRSELLQ